MQTGNGNLVKIMFNLKYSICNLTLFICLFGKLLKNLNVLLEFFVVQKSDIVNLLEFSYICCLEQFSFWSIDYVNNHIDELMIMIYVQVGMSLWLIMAWLCATWLCSSSLTSTSNSQS